MVLDDEALKVGWRASTAFEPRKLHVFGRFEALNPSKAIENRPKIDRKRSKMYRNRLISNRFRWVSGRPGRVALFALFFQSSAIEPEPVLKALQDAWKSEAKDLGRLAVKGQTSYIVYTICMYIMYISRDLLLLIILYYVI